MKTLFNYVNIFFLLTIVADANNLKFSSSNQNSGQSVSKET